MTCDEVSAPSADVVSVLICPHKTPLNSRNTTQNLTSFQNLLTRKSLLSELNPRISPPPPPPPQGAVPALPPPHLSIFFPSTLHERQKFQVDFLGKRKVTRKRTTIRENNRNSVTIHNEHTQVKVTTWEGLTFCRPSAEKKKQNNGTWRFKTTVRP